MKNQITFLILFIELCFCSLQAQVTQEWAARYNGSGNNNDVASSLAVDNSGNTYVTGSSRGSNTGDDYVTIKYNSSGDSLWVRRYNGPGNGYDEPYSIAVDDSGNAYVTGCSYRGGFNYDVATIKYNSSGVLQWVQRYGPVKYCAPLSLAVDSSGNVYLAGTISTYEYATIKYNSSGVLQWVQTYSGGGATSLAVDDSGNVYVTGQSGGDYATIKYNSSGDSLWVARYSGPGNSWDVAHSLAVDDSENVYVTGFSQGSSTAYATIKYNSSGIRKWAQTYNGPQNAFDFPPSLAVDDAENVYVTGTSGLFTNYDYATIKYDSSGFQQWVQTYNGPGNYYDRALSTAIDGSGNVYLTGFSAGNGTDFDYATIKYNTDGVQQWVQRYNGPGNSSDRASSLVIDGSGNVYVSGSSTSSGTGLDYATIKYSQLTGISQTSNSIPETYSLAQNYPNPFNPITNLEFGIPKWGFVSLRIYDVLGKEVAMLVNENLNPGTYNYNFDASGLPSGVYFYKIQAEGFVDTKRMILLK